MVFPGMSPTRFSDIGKFLVLNSAARDLVATADARLGYSLMDRFRQADGDYSEYAQVAFFVACLALARWAEDELGVTPDVCVGPSFGEKPAAVYVGSLPFAEAVWLTAQLARCLEEYFATEYQDVVTQSFARTPEDGLRAVLDELRARGEWSDISCYIDDDFFMVSLREKNLDWLQGKVRHLGGLPLYVMRPPMHSAVFGALRRKAEDEVFAALTFADPRLPVIADQDGTVLGSGAEIRAMLLDSFVRPLRWPDVVTTLRRIGVNAVCVAGPDSLFGRVAVTTSAFAVTAVDPRCSLRRRRGAAVP
jgi:[acyl-carrier-protein] S-malonyltransferase